MTHEQFSWLDRPQDDDDIWRLALEVLCAEEYDSPDDISNEVLGDKLNELRKEYNIERPKLT
jgi:hypothetical protein